MELLAQVLLVSDIFCTKHLFIQHILTLKWVIEESAHLWSEPIIFNQMILLYTKVMNTTNYDYDDLDLLFYNLFQFKSNIFSKKMEIKLLNFTVQMN